MPDYSQGKIYKLVCNKTDLVYIGSTIEPTLTRRLANHRRHYNAWKKGTGNYITSFKILENEDYDIILIEEVSCETKDQLHKRERYHIETVECVNRFIPCQTRKEYVEKNKESFQRYNKEYGLGYREKNATKLLENKKRYYQDNKEIILVKQREYAQLHHEEITNKKKEWYVANKARLLENQKELYELNKEAIKCKLLEKFNCACGKEYTHCNKSRHEKSGFHISFMKSINDSINI